MTLGVRIDPLHRDGCRSARTDWIHWTDDLKDDRDGVVGDRCELALLVGPSIDPEQLSPIQRARWHMLSALCAAPEECRALLESAIESASAVDALHLVQLGVESTGRLFGTGDERSLTLSERLEMRARPAFRPTA